MRFSLNGRSSKLDFDDAQLMTVFKPEIMMAAINRKVVWKTQVLVHTQDNTEILMIKPAFSWSRNTTDLMLTLYDVSVIRKSKMARNYGVVDVK